MPVIEVSLCTTGNLLVYSTIIKFTAPSKWKMSIAGLDQGCTEDSCLRVVVGLGLHLACDHVRQSSQFRVNFSSQSFKPAQYTVSLALKLHFQRPKWPSWMSLSVTLCFLCGTTVLVPFKTIPSSMVSSTLNVLLAFISLGTSLMLLDHPWVIVCLRSVSSSSS